MADHKVFTRALAGFARNLAKGVSISDVLHDLAERVTAVTGADSTAVSVQDCGQLRFATARDDRATSLERVQETGQTGPCVDAWRSGETVVISDMGEQASGSDAYQRAAREAGIVAIAGIPMRLDGQSIGVLDLYSFTCRDWSDEDLNAARVLADVATSYVINAWELDKQRRINEQLQEALDSRIIIEQAKGVLAGERGISVGEAFELLRRHARTHNARLRAVVGAVVNLGLRP
jgi:GAF domain-containing protein